MAALIDSFLRNPELLRILPLGQLLVEQCVDQGLLLGGQLYPTQLSGGMLQRVTMAILWAMRPKYILADEPTSALDEANRDLLLQLLRDYPEPCSILFLSHDTAALTMLCEEIMVLERGRIIERAAADELFQRPKANWTKQFAAASKVREGGDWEWTAS